MLSAYLTQWDSITQLLTDDASDLRCVFGGFAELCGRGWYLGLGGWLCGLGGPFGWFGGGFWHDPYSP